MRPASLISLLLILPFAGPPSLAASLNANETDGDFSLDQTVRFGGIHAAPFFNLKDFGYDDNVRLSDRAVEGDWTLTLGPGARAVVPMGRLAALALREEIDYVSYARESDLNHVNNELRAKLHVWLRDVTLVADGGQVSYRERPNDEIDYRLRHVETKGRFGASWRPEGRLRVGAYLDRTWQRYDAGQVDAPDGTNLQQQQAIGDRYAEILERVESEAVLDARLKLRSRAWLLLEAKDGRIEFERAVPSRDTASRSITTGLEFTGPGWLTGHFRAGRMQLDPDDGAALGFSGWIGQARLAAKLFGRGQARLEYDRRPAFSTIGENLYYIHDRRGLSWEHYLSRRLSVETGRRVTRNDYPIPIDASGLVREDVVTADSFAVRYRLGPSLRVGLGWEHWRRDSSVDDEDAVRNLITTNVEYTP